jgi:hypothetical protein
LCHYKKVVYLIKSYVSAFYIKNDFSRTSQAGSAFCHKNESTDFRDREVNKIPGHDGARTA